MTAMQLMADLARLGIRLKAKGDRLRYSPRSAVTPDLANRMKAHKGELLAMQRSTEVPAPLAEIVEKSISADGTWHFDHTTNDDDDRIDATLATPLKPAEPRCCCHKKQRWWRSIYGDHLICGICHPPATSGVLREWM
jgi:hypothetical protein